MGAEEFRSEMPATAEAPPRKGQQIGARKYVDCRETPSVNNCSIFISGAESEVLTASQQHMVNVHGHQYGPELEAAVRKSMHDVPADERLA